jgi:hypothetical protein
MEYANFDPSTGARISPATGPAAHAQTGGSFRDIYYQQWEPGAVQSEDPHDFGYEPADGQPPSTGPIPANITGGELQRGHEAIKDNNRAVYEAFLKKQRRDFGGDDDDFSDLDDDLGDLDGLDGDSLPQDGDFELIGEGFGDDLDTAGMAENIVLDDTSFGDSGDDGDSDSGDDDCPCEDEDSEDRSQARCEGELAEDDVQEKTELEEASKRSRLVYSSDGGFRTPDGRVLSAEAMRQAGGWTPGPFSRHGR